MSPLKSIARQAEIWWRWFEMALLRLWHFEFQAKFCQNMAKNGRKRPQMTENNLNIWKITSLTLSIGFLLVLRLFWVVIWPVYDNFDFGAKIGQKWPKKAQNDRTWSEYLKSDIRNHLHWISASLAIILSGHMTSLRQVWVWGQNWLKNGQKWPKKAPNGQKWPERMENDFWNHHHWNSAPLAVVLSGHMTSLWQFFLRDPKWPKMAKNGQKWPQNDPKWCDCQKNDWNWFISQIWSIFDCSRMAVPLSPSGGVWTGLNSDFAVVKNFWWVGRLKLFLYQNWP